MIYGILKPKTPFNDIFPDGLVPLASLQPIIPREEGCPPCFVVNAGDLSTEQVAALAKMLRLLWDGEVDSIEQAVEYITEGLPISVEHFIGCILDCDPEKLIEAIANSEISTSGVEPGGAAD